MRLSVIIVSYNVKDLLAKCLSSLQEAIPAAGITGEIIVIDNNSADETMESLPADFPGIKFIGNKINTGFAKACNQGLAFSTGKVILFLNPDTVISGEGLSATLSFLEQRADAGALGVRMINEKGKFLKESKRGFPSPATSFFKLFGFAKLFPRSKVFARYYLGHLEENRNHEVDVLSGAFIMIRREVLEQTGGFDEKFFMYGEDIDLSYRVQKAGYKNYYLGEHSIIHYKGKSTDKGDFQHLRHFYKAMDIFAVKHYKKEKSPVYVLLLRTGIFLHMLLSIPLLLFRRIIRNRRE